MSRPALNFGLNKNWNNFPRFLRGSSTGPPPSHSMSDPISPALRALNARYLDQYFGVWCVHPQRFAATVERVRTIDLKLHVREQNLQREAAAAASNGNSAAP